MPDNSRYIAHNLSASGLVFAAYGVHLANSLVNEPSWAKTTRYELEARGSAETDAALAKLSKEDAYAEKRHMLQELLAERFHLQIHPETRISATYALVAKGKSKSLMVPVSGDTSKLMGTCYPKFSSKGVEVDAKGCSIALLLSLLRGEEGTEVEDHTGMTEAYAYDLKYRPNGMPAQAEGEDYPDLADAVREQLGLELKPTKGPITFWVIDHIEPPTPN